MSKKNISMTILIFIGGVLIVGSVLYATGKVVYRDNRIEKEIEDLKREAAKVKSDNQMLQQRIAYFETPEFQEKMAKEKLNLQKVDENVVIIKQSPLAEEEDGSTQSQEIVTKEELPNHRKWWNYFFSYN